MSDFDPEKPIEVVEAERDPNNAGNPIAVRVKAQVAKDAVKKEHDAIKTLMLSEGGRSWMGRVLFDMARVMASIEPGSFDTNALHFAAGARQLGLHIQTDIIAAAPEQYLIFVKENMESFKIS